MAVVTHERNARGDAQWGLETAITAHADAVVGVEVSYPEGTPDVPDVRALIAAAAARKTGCVTGETSAADWANEQVAAGQRASGA